MDGCCLACSVGAEEAENLASVECQREVVEGCLCAEVFGYALKFQSSGHSGIVSCGGRASSQSAEELSQVLRQQFRLLHCSKVATLWHLRPACDV